MTDAAMGGGHSERAVATDNTFLLAPAIAGRPLRLPGVFKHCRKLQTANWLSPLIALAERVRLTLARGGRTACLFCCLFDGKGAEAAIVGCQPNRQGLSLLRFLSDNLTYVTSGE
ncbi:hypothetical protein BC361_07045 [Ensifer sp. LC54]|nr:hypothetical protein BC361_07045 [Ensifer sp. LC54]OCP18517.1 hypothetical protein BC363_32475 [Ensifer sp. LC384]